MRHWPATTALIFMIALVLTLQPMAQQKPVAPGFSPARAALKGGSTSQTSTPAKPSTQDQVRGLVRDGLGDESGAQLIEQRGIDFAPAEDLLQSLRAAGASEAFLKALRAVVAPGLSPAHAALKGGSTTADPPASAKKPLNQVQVFALLAGQVPRAGAGGRILAFAISRRDSILTRF